MRRHAIIYALRRLLTRNRVRQLEMIAVEHDYLNKLYFKPYPLSLDCTDSKASARFPAYLAHLCSWASHDQT